MKWAHGVGTDEKYGNFNHQHHWNKKNKKLKLMVVYK